MAKPSRYISHSAKWPDAHYATDNRPLENATLSKRAVVIAKIVGCFALIAGSLALADAGLTARILESIPNTLEVNVRVDASSPSALFGGATRSVLTATVLFAASLSLCLASPAAQRMFQIRHWWDEIFIRLPGAAAVCACSDQQ